jgi:hypothetical protein
VQTLTEIVAAVVLHSSAAAYSHFGVTLEPQQTNPPPAATEHTVARTQTPKKAVKASLRTTPVAYCDDAQRWRRRA